MIRLWPLRIDTSWLFIAVVSILAINCNYLVTIVFFIFGSEHLKRIWPPLMEVKNRFSVKAVTIPEFIYIDGYRIIFTTILLHKAFNFHYIYLWVYTLFIVLLIFTIISWCTNIIVCYELLCMLGSNQIGFIRTIYSMDQNIQGARSTFHRIIIYTYQIQQKGCSHNNSFTKLAK